MHIKTPIHNDLLDVANQRNREQQSLKLIHHRTKKSEQQSQEQAKPIKITSSCMLHIHVLHSRGKEMYSRIFYASY